MTAQRRPRIGTSKPGAPIADRLRLHSIAAPSGCRIWLGACDKDGYGFLGLNGRMLRAHRVSYEESVGPIPEGYHVDHLCRRPRCIRPEHLEAVTPRTNIERGTGAVARAWRRAICIHGHPYALHAIATSDGRRLCGQCNREKAARYRARKKAAA